MIGAGLTAEQARAVEQSQSLHDDIETVILPDAESSAFDANRRAEEARKNGEELSELEEANIRGNHAILQQTRGDFWDWKKSRLLERKEAGWSTSIRSDRNGQPPKEYDHFVVGFSAEETAFYRDDIARQKALIDAIKASSRDADGQHAVMISKPHFNTANGHVHVLMHRHAVDVNTQSIGVGVDLGKRSEANQFLERLNEELIKRELPQMRDFRLQDGKSSRMDVVNQQAREEVQTRIQEAGAVPARDPDALERLKAMANTTDAERIAQLAEIARREAESKQAQINRLMQEQEEAIERVKLAQEAQAILMQRDDMQATIDALQARQAELIESNQALNAELEQLTQRSQEQEQQIVDLSQNLSNAQNTIAEKNQEIEGLNLDFDNLQTELYSEQERVHAQVQQIAQLSQQIESMQISINQDTEIIANLSNQRDELQAQNETLKAENESLRESMNDQKLMMQEMRQMMQEMREQMKAPAQQNAAQTAADKAIGVVRLDDLQLQVLQNSASQAAKSDVFKNAADIEDIRGYASQYFGDSRVFFNAEGSPAFMDKGNEVFMTSNKKDDLKAAMAYCVEKFPNGFELIGDYSQRRQLEMIAREMGIEDKIVNPTQRRAPAIEKENQRDEAANESINPREQIAIDQNAVKEFVYKMDDRMDGDIGVSNKKRDQLMNLGILSDSLEKAYQGNFGMVMNPQKTAAVIVNLSDGQTHESAGDAKEVQRMKEEIAEAFAKRREPTDYEKVETFIREIDSQSRKPNSNEIERARAMGLMQGLNLERVIDADDQRIGIFTNADATNYREAAVPVNLESGEVYINQSTGDQAIINRIQAQVDKAFGRGPEQGRDDGRD